MSKTKTFTSKAIVVIRICVHDDHSIEIEIAPKMVLVILFSCVRVCFGYLSMECGLFRCEEKRVQRYIVFFYKIHYDMFMFVLHRNVSVLKRVFCVSCEIRLR